LYVSFIATAVPRNKTLICGVIPSGSLSIHLTASQEVWRNGTYCNLRINPDRAFCVVNGNNVDFIYSFLNLCFAIKLTIEYGNEVCMVYYYSLSLRERVRVRGKRRNFMALSPSSGLRPPSPSGRRDLQ
jgi:hypothetical protein